MRILSWNVQYGKASDGSSDFSRILQHIKSLGEFDVICLQELARNMSEYCIAKQPDHVQMTQDYFEEFSSVWGPGFSWPSHDADSAHRQEFGNVSLVKTGLLDYRVHQLPQPATPGTEQMQRVALETMVDSKMGPLSIINTHLAFHDNNENQQQIEYIYNLEQERIAHHLEPKKAGSGTYQKKSLASARIVCGDCNFTPDTSQYRYQVDGRWIDAWKLSRGEEAHLPTCGIFDTNQWTQGKHCRDYFWLSQEFELVNIEVKVDVKTNLSDHQPVILEISI